MLIKSLFFRSSFEWNTKPHNIPDMYAKAGTPCDEYKGYCDVFNKCREVSTFFQMMLRSIFIKLK